MSMMLGPYSLHRHRWKGTEVDDAGGGCTNDWYNLTAAKVLVRRVVGLEGREGEGEACPGD